MTFTSTPGGSGTFCEFDVDFCHLDVRLQASDAQSGIVDLRTFVRVFWFCGDGGASATSMSEGSPDPVAVASTDQDHDTVLRQYGCDGQSPSGAGNPLPGSQVQGVSGEVFARATNGAGLVTESNTSASAPASRSKTQRVLEQQEGRCGRLGGDDEVRPWADLTCSSHQPDR